MTNHKFQRNLFLLAVLGGCFFVAACSNDPAEVNELYTKKIGVDSAQQIEAYLSQKGIMKAKLKAPQMVRYQDTIPRVEFPNSLHVDFFDDSLKISSQLDALYGRYMENQNKVFLKDSVTVFNTMGDTLHSQELWWDQREQRFYTDKPVRIYKKDMILIGVGMSAPQDFTSFELFNLQPSLIRVHETPQRDSTRQSPDSL